MVRTCISGSVDNSDTVAGFVIVLACVVAGVLIRALVKPRRDAETRCRKCGYILRGLVEPRCSECGEAI